MDNFNFGPDAAAAVLGRGLSRDLWRMCPKEQIQTDPGFGWGFLDDFVSKNDVDQYTATQATAGTFALDDAKGGVVLADCGSTTATQGINVQRASTVGEAFVPNASADIYFEARVKAADIATGPEFFLGLATIDTTVIGSSANTTDNHIGFESVTDDNVLLFHSEKATVRESLTTPHTLVADDWVKLGFKVTKLNKIEVFVNGNKFGEKILTSIPILLMTPTLVCQSGGTTDPIVHLDWLACYQAECIAN